MTYCTLQCGLQKICVLKRFLVVQNLKIAESTVFIFSKLFDCPDKTSV